MKHTREFCDRTSIHGLRYVTEKGAHWFQSLMWATFIVLGGVFCCILMLLVWTRFYTNPTITAVETINYPVWKIPFPTVTICNANKVHRPRIGPIKNILLSNGIEEQEVMLFLSSLANLIVLQKDKGNFTNQFQILSKNGYNTERIMLELMQPCKEFLKRCTWMGDEVNCMDLFKTVKTDEGFCCTFNYYHSNDTYDEGEHLNSVYKQKPIQISGAGIHTGLSVVLYPDDAHYVSSTRPIPSALIHVHDCWDYAEMTILSMVAERNELVQIPVFPSVVDASYDVKSLDRSRRNCLFDEEAQLSIGTYGFENCIIECRMNAIVDVCGCIPYYYNVKHYTYKKDLRFCEIADSHCIMENYRKLYTLYSSDEVTMDNSTKFGLVCTCYPTCDVNWYSYTSDVGHMVSDDKAFNASDVIALHVYFSELSCIKYKQSSLITWDGLFASFGGIFGLCLGGSILSVVEVIYHFTIRLYMSYNSKARRVSDGRKESRNKTNVFLMANAKISTSVQKNTNRHRQYKNELFSHKANSRSKF